MRAVLALAVCAAAASMSAAPASAACSDVAKAPSVGTYGGVYNGGPYVQSCDVLTCGGAVVTTPAQSVPGYVAVGPAYVNDCV
jgi:hypothetical protein